MNSTIKTFLKKVGLYRYYQIWSMKRKQQKELREWENGQRTTTPPHMLKQQVLLEYSRRFHLDILVETGTLHGDMVEAMKNSFKKVYSIELSRELFRDAVERFKPDANVELIHGDSGIELGKLVDRLDGPALFWLDGHYSGGYTAKGEEDTPIYKELSSILDPPGKGHVIIIDDARYFGTDAAYPTIEELGELIEEKQPGSKIEIEDDTIRVTPGKN